MSTPLFVSEKTRPKVATQPLSVGCLIFERMDQIDFTGPFEVLSRMPNSTIRIVGKELAPVRDMLGLRLSPDVSIAEAERFDVPVVPGGYGQQALMHDEEVLGLIRSHAHNGKLVFSVCTGALLCGAAGVLVGRQVTTHWSARHLMTHYGADLVDGRAGRRQDHQRCRRDRWAGCGPCAGLASARRRCRSGDPARHRVRAEPCFS